MRRACTTLVSPYSDLPDDTKKYFVKLPGYDTLRFILATKVVLVEGPTDDLIIQRAYFGRHGKLPSEDGIDIIAVDSLAFKRYLDIAVLIEKPVVIVTDNDGKVNPYLHAGINFVAALVGSFIISSILMRWKVTRFLIGKKA